VPGLLKQQRWKSEQYHIYVLTDPRDDAVRYIGISTNARYRHFQHIHSNNNMRIRQWVRELEKLGMSPEMRIIETVEREKEASDDAFKQIVCDREAYWIYQYFQAGAQLLNAFGVTKRYPHSHLETTSTSLGSSVAELSATNEKWSAKHEKAHKGGFLTKPMPRDGYMTIDEIAESLHVTVSKVRTMIARLDIQPRRFPDDMRKLYYSREDVERIKESLGL
jgi:transposase